MEIHMILNRSFEDVREDGHIMPMPGRTGVRREDDGRRLDLAEVTGRESSHDEVCASYRLVSRLLLG